MATKAPSIPLPIDWPKHVKTGILHGTAYLPRLKLNPPHGLSGSLGFGRAAESVPAPSSQSPTRNTTHPYPGLVHRCLDKTQWYVSGHQIRSYVIPPHIKLPTYYPQEVTVGILHVIALVHVTLTAARARDGRPACRLTPKAQPKPQAIPR